MATNCRRRRWSGISPWPVVTRRCEVSNGSITRADSEISMKVASMPVSPLLIDFQLELKTSVDLNNPGPFSTAT